MIILYNYHVFCLYNICKTRIVLWIENWSKLCYYYLFGWNYFEKKKQATTPLKTGKQEDEKTGKLTQ